MAITPHTTISYATYFNLTRFITRYIHSIDPIEGTGIPSRKLVALCIEDPELALQFKGEFEKKDIEDGIERMVHEGVLMPVVDCGNGNASMNSNNRGVGFRLGEGVKVREMVGREQGEDKENEYSISKGEHKVFILGDEEEESSAEGERDGVMKPRDGNALKTNDYRPRSRPPLSPGFECDADESGLASPKNAKRRRMETIAPSDASISDMLSLSPEKEHDDGDETPKSEKKKIKGSWEESDPDIEEYLDEPMPSLEDELRKAELAKLDPTLVKIFHKLEADFPGHQFEIEGDGFKCLECFGKHLKAQSHNLDRHMRSKAHTQNMDRRISVGSNMNTTFMPQSTRTSMSYFPIPPQEPLAVFANQGSSSTTLAEARNAYHQLLEKETHEKSLRMSFIDHRVTSSEKEQRSAVSSLKERVEGIEETHQGDIQAINDVFRDAQEHNESELKDIYVKVEGIDRRVTDRMNTVDEVISELKKSDEGYELGIQEIAKAATQSEMKLEAFMETTKDRVASFSGKLSATMKENKETLDGFADRVGKVEKSEKVRQLERKLSLQRDKFDEIEDQQKQLKKAVSTLESQGELVSDLEMSMQMLGDEVKQHRECVSQMMQINQRLENELKETRKKVSALEILIEENQRGEEKQQQMERTSLERFTALEKRMEERMALAEATSEENLQGVFDVFTRQREKLADQEEQLEAQQEQIKKQEEILRKHDQNVMLQNAIIKAQRQRLDENERQIKEHGKKIKEAEKLTSRLGDTVPEFMKDVRMLDDRIQEVIDERDEKEAMRAVIEAKRVERLEEQRVAKRTRPTSLSKSISRRAHSNPKMRGVRALRRSRKVSS